MNLATVIRYLFGSANAAREIAANRSAFWAGIWLTLLTGIPRNYDQSYALESPFWLIGPLVFSFISGSFLWLVLIRGFARRRADKANDEPNGEERPWRVFMTLFWMTAPVAWLYAIPVERFMGSYHAAQANLTIMAVVSLWRVLLMSRVMAVLLEVPFLRSLAWVLVAALVEIIVVFFFGFIFGGSLTRRVMAGMSGMRNSPEEQLLGSALGMVWQGSWALLVITVVFLALFGFEGKTRRLPIPGPGRILWLPLVIVTLAWALIAIPAQVEQRAFAAHKALVLEGEYGKALAYLAQRKPSDFPPGRRLEPNPFEFTVWESLPPTIALLKSDTPTWVRGVYLSHLRATFEHPGLGYSSYSKVAAMFSAIERLPEGPQWFRANQAVINKLNWGFAGREAAASDPASRTNLIDAFQRMGIAVTNLTLFRE